MKFELQKLPRNCSDDEILNEIRRVSDMLETQYISRKDFDKHSKISSSNIVKRLNGWQIALTRAGLAHRYNGPSVTTNMIQQKGKKMSDSDLLQELKNVSGTINSETITVEQFNKNSLISAETIRRRFGSWGKALEEAGLKISNRGRRYSDDDYYENMLSVWTHHGRQPKYREMDEPPSFISSGAYEAKWGNFHNALSAFVKKINSDNDPDKTKNPKKINHKNQKRKIEKIRSIPLGIRYDVLRRDNFKCVLCGTSPATDQKSKLHIDHIMPFSQNGKTETKNLRTLCSNCNIGKSDKIE